MLENIFLLKRKWIKVHGNNRPGVAWPYELSPLSVRVRLSSGYAGVDTTHTRLRKICMSDLLTPFFFQLTLYAKCILLHKQDMHLVVLIHILHWPCVCVTLLQEHLAHSTDTKVERLDA